MQLRELFQNQSILFFPLLAIKGNAGCLREKETKKRILFHDTEDRGEASPLISSVSKRLTRFSGRHSEVWRRPDLNGRENSLH